MKRVTLASVRGIAKQQPRIFSRAWHRELWGVEFSADGRPVLIGSTWCDAAASRYHYFGEPTRALLFQSRHAVRAWCAAKHAQYSGRTDSLAKWRFRPVRVVETVRRAK